MRKITRPQRNRRGARQGALLSFELLVVLPILVGILLATIEFSMVLHCNSRLKEASRLACRVASRPCHDPVLRSRVIEETVERVLGRPDLISSYRLVYDAGRHTGDPVFVQVTVPMTAAAPDMLAVVGFSLEDRTLAARTVMYKE